MKNYRKMGLQCIITIVLFLSVFGINSIQAQEVKDSRGNDVPVGREEVNRERIPQGWGNAPVDDEDAKAKGWSDWVVYEIKYEYRSLLGKRNGNRT